MDPDFWHARWEANQIGFHRDEINVYLERYWPALGLDPGSRVLAPLCGKSLDMVWLAAVAVFFSVIGAFYYIRLIKVMYFDPAEDQQPLAHHFDLRFVLTANGLAVLAAVLPPLWVAKVRLTKSDKPRIHIVPDMDNQPRPKPDTNIPDLGADEWSEEFRACLGSWPSDIPRPKQQAIADIENPFD